jgi:outer membrane protease
MIFVIDFWRKSVTFNKFSVVSNYGLILAGALLFLMQMHGYAHSSNPEQFSLASSGSDTRQQIQWKDSISITIPAQGSKEYKFGLTAGASLDYTWQTDGAALYYDFHGDPKGDTTGYFKSYEEKVSAQASGSLTAPFEGIHGWYWRNDTASPVVIELKASGDYRRLDVN